MAMADRADAAGDEQAARDLVSLAMKSQSTPPPAPAAASPELTTAEKIAGSAPYRALQGVADLPLGAAQLLANATGLGDEAMNQFMRERDELINKGRGTDDFDWWRLGGQVLGGAPLGGAANTFKGAVKAGGAIAGSMPVVDDDYWSTKATQVGTGMAAAGAFRPITKGVGNVASWAYNRYAPLIDDATTTAGRAIRAQMGSKADEIVDLLKSDINPLKGSRGSAAEVAAPAQSTKFSALQSAVDEMAPDQAWAREKAQREAQRAVLKGLADVEDPARAFRDEITKPMRETALRAANENTKKASRLAEALGKAEERVKGAVQNVGRAQQAKSEAMARALNRDPYIHSRMPVTKEMVSRGMQRGHTDTSRPAGYPVPPRYSRHQGVLETADEFIDDAKMIESLSKSERDMLLMQANSMRAYGIEKLTPNNIVAGIGRVLKSEKVGNPDVVTTLKRARSFIQREMVKPDGSIDANALYMFRKTGLEKMIQRAMGKEGAAKQSEIAALAQEVRPLLDDAIDTAAGGGWKKYIKAYARLSRPVDQGRVGATLLKSYDKNLSEGRVSPAGLANALEEGTQTLKKSGVTGSSIDDVFNPKQRALLDALRRDVARTDEVKMMAAKGRGTRGEAFVSEDKTLANPLIREIMVTNAVIRAVSKKQQEKMAGEIARLMQRDPNTGFAALISALEKSGPTNRAWVEKLAASYGVATSAMKAGLAAGAGGTIGRE